MSIKHAVLSPVAKIARRLLGVDTRQAAPSTPPPLPPQSDNVAFNRDFWNLGARYWNRSTTKIENRDITDDQREEYLEYLGDEWGVKSHVDAVVSRFIHPNVSEVSKVGEIGVGGGRIASRVASRAKELVCFDISKEMLKKAEAALADHTNVRFVLLETAHLPVPDSSLDFIYSFDVFVHLDLHTIWKYFQEIQRVLRPNGRAMVHTTNLAAPAGWERFASQKEYSVVGHYFISPEIVELLAQRSGLTVVEHSSVDPENFYYNRDYLAVLDKGK